MPTEPFLKMLPGMMPILHSLGVSTPGQLGPMRRDLEPDSARFTFTMGTKDGFAVVRDGIACKPAMLAEKHLDPLLDRRFPAGREVFQKAEQLPHRHPPRAGLQPLRRAGPNPTREKVITALNTIVTAVGDCSQASGCQVCNGKIGILIAKAIKNNTKAVSCWPLLKLAFIKDSIKKL